MTATLSQNCRRAVRSRLTVPEFTVQIEDYELHDEPDLGVYCSFSDHVLSLLQVDYRHLRPKTKFASATNYVTVQTMLQYSPPDVVRHTYPSYRIDQRPVPNHAVCCYFEPVAFHRRTGLGGDQGAAQLAACLSIGNESMMQSMQRLYRELTLPGFASDIVIESLGTLLAVEIARHFKSLDHEPDTRRRLGSRHLERLRDYLEATNRAVTLGDLATECNVSADYLRRLFRNTTGQSLGAYVAQIRIDKAKSLLAANRMPLKQIAQELGFSRPSNFSDAFRRATGETPKAYQRRSARGQRIADSG